MKKLNIVFTIDINYIEHFTVACTSLIENNKENINRICLVHDIQNNAKLDKAIKYFENNYAFSIEQYSLDSTILNSFKITHHISKATYYRLLLSEILPNDIDSVLFLDSDIIVCGDLSELIQIEFLRKDNIEYYIYAVDHKYKKKDLVRLTNIGFRGNEYFNAGIMYINLKKWRKDLVSKTLLTNAKKYNDHLLWWDQDVLNITFNKQWGLLEYKYNAFELAEIKENEEYKIIHYTGSLKPWHFRNKHPYKNLYWQYLKKTPFYYIQMGRIVKKMIVVILRKFFKVNDSVFNESINHKK